MTNQKKYILDFEADAWFERNKDATLHFNILTDPVYKIIQEYGQSPFNILELGSSYGYRLAGLHSSFDQCTVTGLEPSAKAIEYGKSKYPFIDFRKGTCDDLSQFRDNGFNIVIAGFMLYLVDRSLLLSAVKEMDRVLCNHGLLIMIDFFTAKPVRNAYSHIASGDAFSYKLPYENIFTSTGMYHLFNKNVYSTLTKEKDGSHDIYNKMVTVALKKDLYGAYE